MIENVIVYDNGGKSIDRYTVVHETSDSKDFYGMGEDPSTFNQYIGSSPDYEEGEHLGLRLGSIPKCLEQAIRRRLA